MNRYLGTLAVAIICTMQALGIQKTYDLVVYGETAAGVVAAIQAGRMQQKVALIARGQHVGGMVTSGLTATDMNRNQLVGGVTREFYQRIYAYYEKANAWRNQDRESFMLSTLKRTYTGKNDSLRMQWVYESHVAEEILKEMLEEASVELIFGERLDLQAEVRKNKGYISEITMESGRSFGGKMFIDATYEGDLMARAGVSYIVGREANSAYKETLNGIRMNHVIGSDEKSVSPYVEVGNPASGLLPYIDGELWGAPGTADGRTQAYCYRLTLTDDPANRLEITKPAGYNAHWYEVLARKLQMQPETTLQQIITLTPMPNRKTDTNHLDFFGASYDYAEGDYTERQQIEQLHKDYALGMLWFLANDPRVTDTIRKEMKNWGLPKDEFLDTEHFPYQIYVREARRMIGSYVMTEHNIRGEEKVEAPQSVGLATYALDCHFVSQVVDSTGRLRYEGTMFEGVKPYPVSYQALIPKAEECKNLLVPICLSSSHVAYSSIRMEPVYMQLGQAAATAAALALKNENKAVQKVSYEKLRDQLLKDKQIIAVP
ncbi:FAD-dependent oxidoreductase [Olivibacter sp. SDN3]|uniref:FAD-dependent oxidoreductase n=1 Tax=Olivibacter sp. SDN3 TaxID=2764720 RepID=UPI00165177FE|nr:FAD-dependent oxidoreductase [Olivibacter sp. SDN3]QNL47841.1 FAD-dependent oxidoreductase [Olivibacter sp. SDN3]